MPGRPQRFAATTFSPSILWLTARRGWMVPVPSQSMAECRHLLANHSGVIRLIMAQGRPWRPAQQGISNEKDGLSGLRASPSQLLGPYGRSGADFPLRPSCLARHPRLELRATTHGRPRVLAPWRGGRVVDCTALEMRHGCKPIGGSNPPLSAITLQSLKSQ